MRSKILQREFFGLISLLLLLSVAHPSLRAQTFNLKTGREPIASLDGLWRFHTGDNPAWASPNFDDSHWPLLRSDESWSKQGYKGYGGMAWYRFRVTVPAGMNDISLYLPQIATCYQVYANGSLIGTYGKMPPHPIAYSGGGYRIYLLPSANGMTRSIAIAIRVWHWPSWAMYVGGGPHHGGGLAGLTGIIRHQEETRQAAVSWRHSGILLLALLQTLAGFGALALFLLRRSEREYLWFCVLMFLSAAIGWMWLLLLIHGGRVVLVDGVIDGLSLVGVGLAEIAFYFYLLKARRTPLFWTALVCLAGLLLVIIVWECLLPSSNVAANNAFEAVLQLPLYVWVLSLLFTRARQNLFDARLLLAPVLIQISTEIFQNAAVVTFILGWQQKLGYNIVLLHQPFDIGLQQAADALFLLAVLAILVHRFTRTRSQEERYASELEAARSVQSLLVPAAPPSMPGFQVESVYLPASEVGGDFFQVQPGNDGSLLVVVGDVSGKGLKAAMTVSTIVGALRGCALRGPADVLAYLNRVLYGQVSGFVTCSAALIASDGAMTIANAGHLSPYRNGEEMVVASGLPLGILAEGSYEETHYQLAPGDRLTFVSDGVVEATNERKELFGFERTQQISDQPAQTVAEAAKQFGQEDDITVVTVTRSLEAIHAV